MHLNADISSALQQIEAVKKGIEESNDAKLQMETEESLKTILDILQDPVFRTIVHVQDSLSELNSQLSQHPSMLPNDFDIDVDGNLVLSVNGDAVYDFDDGVFRSTQISAHSPSPESPISDAVMMSAAGLVGSTEHSLLDDLHDRDIAHPLQVEDITRPQSQNSKLSAAVDLPPVDYVQIQAIELVNDGTGLGFGIVRSRFAGVIVKTILPGGVADRDGRLHSGDHILRIGDVNLHDMVSEQVASVLRQSGTHVRLVVARTMENALAMAKHELAPGCAIVPSRLLVDPTELESYLIAAGYSEIIGESSTASTTPQAFNTEDDDDDRFVYTDDVSQAVNIPTTTTTMDISKRPPMATPLGMIELLELPETEKLQVELTKDSNGLGITIAGYVCEKEELSGIFVKSVSPGSAADMSGRIRVNDRIIEVDGQSLQGYSNHQAVELLKKSGEVVNLCLERYLRGPKFEQLQQAIAANDKMPHSSLPSTPARNAHLTPQQRTSNSATFATATVVPTTMTEDENAATKTATAAHNAVNTFEAIPKLPALPPPIISQHSNNDDDEDVIIAASNNSSNLGVGKQSLSMSDDINFKIIPEDVALSLMDDKLLKLNETVDNVEASLKSINSPSFNRQHKYYVEAELSAEVEQEIIRKWKKIVGTDIDVIVAQIKKFAVGGLGISLEGTVDVEGGREVRPHHYIRSILADGPVGVNGVLRSGDELLEVNGERLLGMNHLEVVAILKDLPQNVRMVCGRSKAQALVMMMPFSDDTLKKLSSNLENLLPTSERLVKAKSDGSLATTSSGNDDSFNKLKSRSLEPLTGLAMWSSEPQIIELVKGDRGLGFSILDYQDPLDPHDTLIVIRSLVPGGVAQMDGRLIPGDRLLFVNAINLENASLDQAVQALKGAPKGLVRIGVAKPLPMTDNSHKSSNSTIETAGIGDASFAAGPDIIPSWSK